MTQQTRGRGNGLGGRMVNTLSTYNGINSQENPHMCPGRERCSGTGDCILFPFCIKSNSPRTLLMPPFLCDMYYSCKMQDEKTNV